MRELLIIFVILLSQHQVFGQFETYKEKNKIGLTFNGVQIQKAKYDKINLLDDSIATAIKKTKRYYINSSGDIVYKTKLELSEDFEDGLGIVKNKKEKYQLVNRKGSFAQGTEYGTSLKPKRILKVIEYGGTGQDVYNRMGLVPMEYDSLAIYEDWLIVYKTHQEPYTVKIKDDTKFFGRRKVTRYHESIYFDIYNNDASYRFADKVVAMEYYGSHFILKRRDSSGLILNSQGQNIVGSFTNHKLLSENFISARQDSSAILINLEKDKIELKGDYLKFEFKNEVVHAIKKDTDSLKVIDIFYNGELVSSNLNFIKFLDDKKIVTQDSTGLFISSSFGQKIVGPYTYIGEIKSEHVLVCDSSNFMYINSNSWKELGFYYPLIEAKVYSRKGPPKDFIGAFFYTVLGGWLSDGIDQIEIVDYGHDFYEGWAICAVNVSSASNPFQKRAYIASDDKLRYNYINPKNEKLNSKKYKDCFPMYNGRAWVKERNLYSVIDSTGKPFGHFNYDKVILDPSGYFYVEKKGLRGIVSPEYIEVVGCEHDQLHTKNGAFYNGYGEEEKLIHKP